MFVSSRTQIASITVELAKECADVKKNETVDLDLMSSVETIFKSLSCLNGSFLTDNDEHANCSKRNSGVDIVKVEEAFEYIRKMENENLKSVVSVVVNT